MSTTSPAPSQVRTMTMPGPNERRYSPNVFGTGGAAGRCGSALIAPRIYLSLGAPTPWARIPPRSMATFTSRRQFLAAGAAAAGLAAARAHAWEPSPRYPDPAVRVLDPVFAKYRVNLAKVERLGTGYRWSEGPAWFG